MKLRDEDGFTSEISNGSGIYLALNLKKEVLYVGVATRLRDRIRFHRTSPWLRFMGGVLWVTKPIPYSELPAERRYLIEIYKPKGNGRLGRPKRRKGYKWARELAAKLAAKG
jgi:hypothetical protein